MKDLKGFAEQNKFVPTEAQPIRMHARMAGDPLVKGAVSQNIRTEMRAGRPQKQAIAIAMETARRSKR